MPCADGSRRGRLALVALFTAALGLSEARMAMAGEGWPTVAQAQGVPADRPITLRGTVVSVDRAELRMATAAGPEMVTGAVRASLTDIGPGTFLGTAARAQADGTFRALEVPIFPEAMRGTGEGHRPMEGGRTRPRSCGIRMA
jgi:hypothetical protein